MLAFCNGTSCEPLGVDLTSSDFHPVFSKGKSPEGVTSTPRYSNFARDSIAVFYEAPLKDSHSCAPVSAPRYFVFDEPLLGLAYTPIPATVGMLLPSSFRVRLLARSFCFSVLRLLDLVTKMLIPKIAFLQSLRTGPCSVFTSATTRNGLRHMLC